MEVFSLEEDDCPELFITQSSSDSNGIENNSILVDENDFQSPCVSLVSPPKQNALGGNYEDISDDDFDIPSSQLQMSDNR